MRIREPMRCDGSMIFGPFRLLASAEHLVGAQEAGARRLTDGDMPV
jgi:hypothetical protein